MVVRMPGRVRWLLSLVLAAVLALAACSSDGTTSSSTASGSAPGTTTSGTVLVFAAASLTEAFTDERETLKTEQPALSITNNFAGSGALVTQIQQGAPADVIATADTASMQKLIDADLVEAPVTFAANRLEILVAPGNPLHVNSLSDLARPDITFVTEDESVPAGKYATQALSAAGVHVSPVSKEADVKSAVAKVTSGEADATIVYQTDVTAAATKGTGVSIPEDQNVIATYPIAIVKASGNRAAAAAYVDAIVHGSGRQALADRGFLPPP